MKHDVSLLTFVRRDGEIVAVRRTARGAELCPVCGWESLPSGRLSPGFYLSYIGGLDTGSQEICPCCKTQFGLDDHVSGSMTLQSMWKKLRLQWLAEERWADDKVAQVSKALDIDREYLMGEKNRWHQAHPENT